MYLFTAAARGSVVGDYSEDDHIGDEQRTDRYRQLIGERGAPRRVKFKVHWMPVVARVATISVSR